VAQQLRGCGGRKVTGGTTGEQVAQQQVRYASGRVVSVMSSAFTGEGKTDAKDAHVIAETARLRRDLSVVDQVSDLARNLAVLTAHRADLVADRVRGINRLRDLLTSVSGVGAGIRLRLLQGRAGPGGGLCHPGPVAAGRAGTSGRVVACPPRP